MILSEKNILARTKNPSPPPEYQMDRALAMPINKIVVDTDTSLTAISKEGDLWKVLQGLPEVPQSPDARLS